MVSFSCEGCGDVLTKKKLDPHRNQCRGATFTCLDCMVHFPGTEYRSHTSCISEAQKYQGHLYRPEKEKGGKNKRKSMNGNGGAMVPRGAYVEDAVEGDDMNAVAVIDVPPRAPTPPPAPEALPESVNVFDFLVSDATPKGAVQGTGERKMLDAATPYGRNSQYSTYSNGNGSHYTQHGYSYGNAPLQPSFDRYDSWNNLNDSQQTQASMAPPPYVTPAPKEHRKEKKDKRTAEKSGSKRKRNVEDLDLSSVKRPVSRDEAMTDAPMTAGRTLHTGLTGGLSKLVTDPDFYEDRIEAGPTPISPIKRNKREKDIKDALKEERRKSSYVSSWNGSKTASSKHSRDRSRSPDRSNRHVEKLRRSQREDSFSSEDRSRVSRRKAIDYPDRPSSVQPSSTNQVMSYRSRAELFMSFINKGPDSERGCSINKALKRYHRERDVRGDEKDDEDKELWKSLRVRRNSRGEVVLFI